MEGIAGVHDVRGIAPVVVGEEASSSDLDVVDPCFVSLVAQPFEHHGDGSTATTRRHIGATVNANWPVPDPRSTTTDAASSPAPRKSSISSRARASICGRNVQHERHRGSPGRRSRLRRAANQGCPVSGRPAARCDGAIRRSSEERPTAEWTRPNDGSDDAQRRRRQEADAVVIASGGPSPATPLPGTQLDGDGGPRGRNRATKVPIGRPGLSGTYLSGGRFRLGAT